MSTSAEFNLKAYMPIFSGKVSKRSEKDETLVAQFTIEVSNNTIYLSKSQLSRRLSLLDYQAPSLDKDLRALTDTMQAQTLRNKSYGIAREERDKAFTQITASPAP